MPCDFCQHCKYQDDWVVYLVNDDVIDGNYYYLQVRGIKTKEQAEALADFMDAQGFHDERHEYHSYKTYREFTEFRQSVRSIDGGYNFYKQAYELVDGKWIYLVNEDTKELRTLTDWEKAHWEPKINVD